LPSVALFSQTDCKCDELLKQVIHKVETEYPGFIEKTKNINGYTSFKNALIDSVKYAPGKNCQHFLEQYCNYFKDGHLVLTAKTTNNGVASKTNIELADFELSDFEKYLLKSEDKLEGIWKSEGYNIGLKKQKDGYIGFIISSENKSWLPKEIKFKLSDNNDAIYFKGNHSEVKEKYQVCKDCILYFEGIQVSFVRELPKPILPKDSISNYLNEIEGFYVKPISKRTLLLRISSFDYNYVDRINELIQTNNARISNTENLIIDLRGNGGGTDNAYKSLLPFLYTNPVRYLSGEYLVSQTLIDNLENWTNSADTLKYADEITSVRKDINRMKANVGKFIPYSEDEMYGFTQQNSIYPFPQMVAILVDKKCGSSTEKFILDAKQSKKVKIMGTTTYGAVDYVSALEFKLVCQDFTLYMPTVRMMRLPDYPIDNIGIQPDIYLDKFVDDWVDYAKRYLEN